MQELKCPDCGHLNPDIRELGHKLPNTCGRCTHMWRLQDVMPMPKSADQHYADRPPSGFRMRDDEQAVAKRDNLYARLESLSKALESSGRIDEYDYPDAYATVLDAMNFVLGVGFTRLPSLREMEMISALELIASPMRPDGTWNRGRAACQELAARALGRYDDSKTPNVGGNRP